jgi:ferredoxin/flavodoxin---NADP+ reductase
LLHKVINIRNISPSTYAIRVERKNITFKAGQCFNLGVKSSGVNREYSIYSGESDPFLEFLVKEVKGGAVSPSLRKVQAGEEVELHGPYGSFILNLDQVAQSPFLFIGTGTGIAPFHSFVQSFPDLEYNLVVGIRTFVEQYDIADYDTSRLAWCVSRESGEGFNGRVTTYLKGIKLDPKSVCYLCGNQRMIHDVYDLLRENGISGDQIFTEAFF